MDQLILPRRFVLAAVLALTIATLTDGIAGAADIREPKTGVAFEGSLELNGKSFLLAGVGLRTRFLIKVYAQALYLESSAKNDLSLFREQASKPGQPVFDAVIAGKFEKLFVLHFVRDVGYERIQKAFKEGLELTMNVEAPDVKEDVRSFLNSFKDDVDKGEELKILVEEEQVTVISPSGATTVIRNAKIAMGTSACWLGRNAVQEDLKRSLLNRLSTLL